MHTEISDISLLQAWQLHGDAEAFHTIVGRHARLVYNTCRHILRNEADAADVSQECFLCLAVTPPDIQYSLSAWLHRLATHRSLDHLKAANRRREREVRYARETVVAGRDEQADLMAMVDEAIDALPDDLRLPLVDHFFSQKSHQQVALELGVPRRTVSYRINSGVEQLREALNRRGVAAPVAGLAALLEWQRAEAEALPKDLQAVLGKYALAGVSRGARPFKRSAFAMVSFSAPAFLIAAIVVLVCAALWLLPGHFSRPAKEVAPVESNGAAGEDLGASTTSTGTNTAEDTNIERAAAGEAQAEIAGGMVSGRVYDADTNAPIAGAEVKIAKESDTYAPVATCTTDAEGRYATGPLPPGAYMIYRGKTPGYGATSEKTFDKTTRFPVREMEGIRFRLSEDTNIDVPVRKGLVVSGVVVDKFGIGIPGVTVSGQTRVRNDRQTTRTDASGTFYLAGFSNTRDFCLTAHKKGFGRRSFTRLDLGYPGLENMRIELPDPSSISGRVTNSDGTPLAEARVIAAHGDALHRWPLQYPEDFTDDQGRYRIDDLGTGQYAIHVYLREYDHAPNGNSIVVDVDEGDLKSNVDITAGAAPGFKVSGIVTDTDGNPIPNGLISLGPRDTVMMTDATGRFSMKVREGFFEIHAGVPGYHIVPQPRPIVDINSPTGQDPLDEGRIEISSERDDLHIRVNRNNVKISGRVIAADSGEPIPYFELIVLPGHGAIPGSAEHWQGAQRVYSLDGTFLLEELALESGACTVFVVAPDYGVGTTNLTIPADTGEADATVTISQRPPISGIVVDHQGVPVAGADIYTSFHPLETRVASTRADGTFKAAGVPVHSMELTAFHPKYPPVIAAIPQNSETELRFQFQPAGCVVVDVTRDGKPANMTTVSVSRERTVPLRLQSEGLLQKVANYDGRVEFTGMPVGETNISASAVGRWGNSISKSQTVTVSAGKRTQVTFDLTGGTASIRGTYLHNGRPIPQSTVGYSLDNGGDELNFSKVASQVDGSWEFGEVPPGTGTLRFFMHYEGGSVERLVTVEVAEGEAHVVDIDEGSPTDAEQYASLHGVVLIDGSVSLSTNVHFEVANDDTALHYRTSSELESQSGEWDLPAVLSGAGVLTIRSMDSEGNEYEYVEELNLTPLEAKSLEINLTEESLVEEWSEQ